MLIPLLSGSAEAQILTLGEAPARFTLDDFRWLDEGGLVQEARLGDGSRIWDNFRAQVDGELLAAESVRARPRRRNGRSCSRVASSRPLSGAAAVAWPTPT